ncbi:MAG TPA: DUF4924 family protein [Bacteroidales bacterium]|nr:DUF4924 family protein [Bacteroidales bacterium]
MIIAQQKQKENIIEYILYLRQIQDIIRAADFNINTIENSIVNKYKVSEKIKSNIRQWYSDFILDLKSEKKEKSGDISKIEIVINEINLLHISLLNNTKEYKHAELYRWAKPYIEEFKNLSKQENANDVKICIDALYSLLLLRIKGQSISEDTMQAMQTFSNLLAHLALKYKQQEQSN